MSNSNNGKDDLDDEFAAGTWRKKKFDKNHIDNGYEVPSKHESKNEKEQPRTESHNYHERLLMS